jgi:HAD superfamily hydrolase (TIGR01509 family)
MGFRRTRLRLVIFDCDGVLVDSEPVSSRVVAAALTALGWPMTSGEADRLFLGMTLTDMVPVIERQLGWPVPPGWQEALVQDLVQALAAQAEPVAGALEALAGVSALGLPWRVASNSSHAEMQVKFTRLGILPLVAGRLHSAGDVRQGKPSPDVFLAAAAAERVPAPACLVIEDSLPGVRAAAAAGMGCLAYAPHSDGAALSASGAVPFHSMFDVPGLVAAALRRAA